VGHIWPRIRIGELSQEGKKMHVHLARPLPLLVFSLDRPFCPLCTVACVAPLSSPFFYSFLFLPFALTLRILLVVLFRGVVAPVSVIFADTPRCRLDCPGSLWLLMAGTCVLFLPPYPLPPTATTATLPRPQPTART
jgi:hypothetical protein